MAYTYKYPRPAVTADCIVITKETEPKVLLIERGDEPFKGCWAFPGGFMDMDETTEQCAIRDLEEETGLKVCKVYQIGAYSKVIEIHEEGRLQGHISPSLMNLWPSVVRMMRQKRCGFRLLHCPNWLLIMLTSSRMSLSFIQHFLQIVDLWKM